jgi:transposase
MTTPGTASPACSPRSTSPTAPSSANCTAGTAIEFRKFLAAIDKAVPAGLDVHLVCDDYVTHNTPGIRTWLARRPRFRVHFTPTGSSWMNQVERWFGPLTDKLIRRGVHKSVQALEADIRDWIEQWNENPRPFAWTRTADEILNSLAEYLSKISGEAHRPGPAPSPADPGTAENIADLINELRPHR